MRQEQELSLLDLPMSNLKLGGSIPDKAKYISFYSRILVGSLTQTINNLKKVLLRLLSSAIMPVSHDT